MHMHSPRTTGLLIMAAAASAATAAASTDYDCGGGGSGISVDPGNCAGFIMCSNGIPFKMDCPTGTHFSATLLVCDFPHNVDCDGRPQDGAVTTPKMPISPTTVGQWTTSTSASTSRTTIPFPSTLQTPSTTAKVSTLTTKSSSTLAPTTPTTHFPTSAPTTTPTTPANSTSGEILRYPAKVVGMYLALASDSLDAYHTNNDDWEPKLYKYQQEGANVLFFTFINPETMIVPGSFQKLAKSRGTGADGAVPENTVIVFAIGGLEYSIGVNPWPWLTSREAAEEMAGTVATWVSEYGMDGVDLDIEEGAGESWEAGQNMLHFLRRLKELQPQLIVGQPTYGFPQIQAEIDVINHSWNVDSSSNDLASSIGIMVYEGAQSLNYVANYAAATDQWEGFPVRINVPEEAILVGCRGTARPIDIMKLTAASIDDDLLGIMVWFASVRGGFQYDASWDAGEDVEAQQAFVDAMNLMKSLE